MTTEQRARLIAAILATLKFTARNKKTAFDEGDTFFALAFRSDCELRKIARLAGIV
jgi:hypothetical protein